MRLHLSLSNLGAKLFVFILNIIIETAYIIDIFVLLFKPIYKDQEFVTKLKIVILNRLKDFHFYIDIISAFPSVIITEIMFKNQISEQYYNTTMNMLYILKIFKVRYTFDMIDILFTWINSKTLMECRRVFKLCLATLFVIHIMSCLFIFMGQNKDLGFHGWMIKDNLIDKSNLEVYITAVYWSTVTLATVGYGDIIPTNKDEAIFLICIIILASLCYAVFVSVVGDFFSSRFKANSRYICYVLWIEKLRKQYNLPYKTVFKLEHFYKDYINEQEISVTISFDSLLKTFPKMLRLEVMLYVYKDAVQSVKFLKDRSDEFYLNILSMVKSIQLQKGEVVIRQGAVTNECYIVVNGNIVNNISKGMFGRGNIFGVVDIIYKRNRQESFYAETECSLLKFERADFEQFLKDYPDIESEIKLIAERRDEFLQDILRERKRVEEAKK